MLSCHTTINILFSRRIEVPNNQNQDYIRALLTEHYSVILLIKFKLQILLFYEFLITRLFILLSFSLTFFTSPFNFQQYFRTLLYSENLQTTVQKGFWSSCQ